MSSKKDRKKVIKKKREVVKVETLENEKGEDCINVPRFLVRDNILDENVSIEIVPVRFFAKGLNGNRKIILIVKVIKGLLLVGDKIVLLSPHNYQKSITTKVAELQKNDIQLASAKTGEMIGISLSGVTLRQMNELNKSIPADIYPQVKIN